MEEILLNCELKQTSGLSGSIKIETAKWWKFSILYILCFFTEIEMDIGIVCGENCWNFFVFPFHTTTFKVFRQKLILLFCLLSRKIENFPDGNCDFWWGLCIWQLEAVDSVKFKEKQWSKMHRKVNELIWQRIGIWNIRFTVKPFLFRASVYNRKKIQDCETIAKV